MSSSAPAAASAPSRAPPLSDEQRRFIVDLHRKGLSPRDIALLTDSKEGTIAALLYRIACGGSVERAYKPGHGRDAVTPAQHVTVVNAAASNVGSTLAQIAAISSLETKRKLHRTTISEHLKQEEFSRKRLRVEPIAKNTESIKNQRIDWLNQWEAHLTAENTLYFDETQINTGDVPSYGWAPKGQPAVQPRPQWRGPRISIIGAFSAVDGLAYETIDQSTNAETFERFFTAAVKRVKDAEHIRYYFILDNASIHNSAQLQSIATAASKQYVVLKLPPYSSRLNPIEQVWNAFKAPVKHADLTDKQSVLNALVDSYQALDRSSFRNYFDHIVNTVYPSIRAREDMH